MTIEKTRADALMMIGKEEIPADLDRLLTSLVSNNEKVGGLSVPRQVTALAVAVWKNMQQKFRLDTPLLPYPLTGVTGEFPLESYPRSVDFPPYLDEYDPEPR